MTSPITLRIDRDLAHVTFDDGRGNALNESTLRALDEVLAEAATQARVVILRGREKVFCGGLDLPTLVDLDRPALLAFLRFFDDVHARLVRFPRPVVTVVRGSAIAGGAILACVGDARLCTPGGKVGVNESQLGLNIPTAALELVRMALGERNAAEAVQTGALYAGDDRVRVGFATEICPPESIDARADELAAHYAKGAPEAVSRLRAQLRVDSSRRIDRDADVTREQFAELWFRPDVRARLSALAASLKAR